MADDRVALAVNGRWIENFERYSVESDLYTADDAFSLELSNPETPVTAGMRCELYVNDTLELTGIIDRTRKRYDKGGVKLLVEGRDLMGLLVDTYAEDFISIEGMKVKALAEKLIGKTARHPALPFIGTARIEYLENFVGKGKGKKKAVDSPLVGFLDTPQKISQIEPGMTVFEVLRTYAMSRGLMFYAMPDGTMVFGRPKAKGEPLFQLICRRDGAGNNVLEGELVDDLSKRYSKISVIAQVQGQNEHGLDATKINPPPEVVYDTDFPFYKPFVTRLNHDAQSPKLHARLLREKMRHDGFQLLYQTAGHAQGEYNWRINELCRVTDEVLGLDDVYLIYGRIFERSKQGSFTRLKLGLKGLVA